MKNRRLLFALFLFTVGLFAGIVETQQWAMEPSAVSCGAKRAGMLGALQGFSDYGQNWPLTLPAVNSLLQKYSLAPLTNVIVTAAPNTCVK